MSDADNPLLAEWKTPHEMPPFADIRPEHFQPAFEAALTAHDDEIAAIAGDTGAATLENTIAALEQSGRTLRKVSSTFFNLVSADTSPELQEIERDIAPRLAKHQSDIYLNEALYARVAALVAQRDALDLNDEQARVLERYAVRFERAGARLDAAGKARMAEIGQRLAELSTQFAQNVLADESGFRLVLEGEADLAGLPDFLRAAAAQTAADLGLSGQHVITLARSSIDPFLQFSERRDLREQAFKAWTSRGANGGETDNRALIAETVALRTERARLLGFETFAGFKLDDTMAKTPEAVRDLLMQVWAPGIDRAARERDALQAMVRSEGGNFDVAAWDWRYYSEKVRKAEHDLDTAEIKPYFQLERMIDAVFDTANRLFGLGFEERDDVPTYHPDVRVWEVSRRDGSLIGLFCGDYFARPSKQGGAWMSAFRSQQKLAGDITPIIVNVTNFVKGAPGEPTLLSFEDARTLFHEFGHGLHGLLSDLTYPTLAGTSVSGDFVELPSQLYAQWLMRPEVLRRFAVHADTGAPMPEELLDRIIAAQTFNQGFATVEYVSSSLVDLELHSNDADEPVDADRFEAATLAQIGMPPEITMRHRLPHFLHLFNHGYAAGYYSYLWSEVMDADAFSAFEEAGDVYDRDTAQRLHDFIYSAGNLRDPADAYIGFRGKPPTIDALLEKRGLKPEDAATV
ncbi:MAG: M3 family metallopeptidase [Methyloligellaceae bacterium]